MDENWETALSFTTCESKISTAKREKIVEVPKNGDWSQVYEGTLTQAKRPHVWFMTVSD